MADVVRMVGMGVRGESWADIARRVGEVDGVPVSSNASDAAVLGTISTGFADLIAANNYVVIEQVVAAATANVTVSNPGTDAVAIALSALKPELQPVSAVASVVPQYRDLSFIWNQ